MGLVSGKYYSFGRLCTLGGEVEFKVRTKSAVFQKTYQSSELHCQRNDITVTLPLPHSSQLTHARDDDKR